MNRRNEGPESGGSKDDLELEPELRQALSNFKSSVDAWSESAISRPRQVTSPARANWGLVTKWALGCAVFVTTVSGGVYEHHRQQEAAKAEVSRIARQQQEVAAQRAKEEADLMAKVDSDISREVPSALEPLASLMNENQSTGN